MGRVTVLLWGLPSYVTLVDLSYYLECLFDTNSEIVGIFDLRPLRRNNKMQLVALDFHSGFDAIAAQEQLDNYRYEMLDGTEYILHAKITNKKEYLRSYSSPESSRTRSRSPNMENEAWLDVALIPTMSEDAVLRANAKLDAQYALLQKKKLIVESRMELLKKKRKLQREYRRAAETGSDDSDDSSTCSRKPGSYPRQHRSWSQELELFKIKQAAKIQDKTLDYCKQSASTYKQRSPSWDIEQPRALEREKSRSRSRERSLRTYRYKVRSRKRRSRSSTRSPRKAMSRERSSKYRSRSKGRCRVLRSRSFTRSPSKSRSRTPSPRPRRSRSRRHCDRRSCYRDSESIGRSRYRSSYKRSRSPNSFRSKRLRSPGSSRRRSRSRSLGRLLAIMPKSPVKVTSAGRSKANRSEVDNSDVKVTTLKKKTKRENSPEHTENKNTNLSGYDDLDTKTEANNISHLEIKAKENFPKKDCTITSATTTANTIEKKLQLNTNTKEEKINTVTQSSKLEDIKIIGSNNSDQNTDEKILEGTHNDTESTEMEDAKNKYQTKTKKETTQIKGVKNKEFIMKSICNDIMFLMQSLLLEITIKENIEISHSNARIMKEKLIMVVQERVKILYVDENISVFNACESYRKICTKQDDTLLLKKMLDDIKTQEADLTISQNDPSPIPEAAHDLPENTIQKVSDVELAIDTNGSKQENVTNKDENNIEQKSLETNNENKTEEVIEIVDIEAYPPKKSWIKDEANTDKPPACPQFMLVTKRLMKQLKPAMQRSREQGVHVNYFDMKQVLRILLRDMLREEEGYKNSSKIVALFRQKYPRHNDVEFVKKVAEDLHTKKYDIEGMDEEHLDEDEDDDVIYLENKYEVIVVSDDEPDDIRDNILYIINNLNELIENENIKMEPAYSTTETEPIEINKIQDTGMIETNDSEKTNDNGIIESKEITALSSLYTKQD